MGDPQACLDLSPPVRKNNGPSSSEIEISTLECYRRRIYHNSSLTKECAYHAIVSCTFSRDRMGVSHENFPRPRERGEDFVFGRDVSLNSGKDAFHGSPKKEKHNKTDG